MCSHTYPDVHRGWHLWDEGTDSMGVAKHGSTSPLVSDSFPEGALLTNGTLVHILVTCPPSEARWTSADGSTAHRVRVTDSILMAGVADTCIIQVTQEA